MTYSISGPFYWFGLLYRTTMYIGLVKARYDQIKMIRCRAWSTVFEQPVAYDANRFRFSGLARPTGAITYWTKSAGAKFEFLALPQTSQVAAWGATSVIGSAWARSLAHQEDHASRSTYRIGLHQSLPPVIIAE